jgi:hypothetical protein
MVLMFFNQTGIRQSSPQIFRGFDFHALTGFPGKRADM